MARLTGKNAQIAEEIRSVLLKHGIAMNAYTHRIDEGGAFSLSIKCQDKNATGADGEKTSPQREAYKRHAVMYGYKPEWLDVEFVHSGRLMVFEGFNMGRPKNFISMIEKSTGKRFMTSELGIKEQLTAACLKRSA